MGLAFLLSGSAGLIHEIVWVRLLGQVFGVTSLAVATVLAAFMGGLALGSAWLGRRTHRLADPLRAYAWLEIGVGASALLVPALLAAVEPAYGWLWRRYHPSFAVFSLARLVVAAAVLLPPTVMMGGTFPVLAHHLAGLARGGITPQWLYALNLAGAVAGVAAAGFLLMPGAGVWATLVTGTLLNLGVGLGVWLLSRPAHQPGTRTAPSPVREEGWSPVDRRHVALTATACLGGTLAMISQIAWTRVLALVVGSTTYAFSSVLLVYLIALGAGSAWAARRASKPRGVGRDLVIVHLLMAVGMVVAVGAVNQLPLWYTRLSWLWPPQTLVGVLALNATIGFAVLLWPVLAAGTVLPLTITGVLAAKATRTGRAVGYLYAANTVGAIVGAVFAGFFLIPAFGARAVLLGVATVGAGTACLLSACLERPRWVAATALAVAPLVAIGASVAPRWNHLHLHVGVFEPGRLYDRSGGALVEPGQRILYHAEGRTATVIVVERRNGDRSLVIDARTNASTAPPDMATQVLLAQLPLLLAPDVDEVFIVGWGSGVTAGAATRSSVKRITAVELEGKVVEASRFFDHVNHEPLGDSRLRLLEDDARHVLFASSETYDVIISEPPHPWIAGVASLFTRDFYELAARRLRPEGVFAQWLQYYQVSFETYRSVVASFQSVFPEVLIYNPPGGSDTILLGSRRPLRFDLDAVHGRWRRAATRDELRRVGIERPEDLLAGFYFAPDAVREMVEGARLNTDGNMYVEFRAAREALRDQRDLAAEIVEAFKRYVTPVERVLADPRALLARPERLEAVSAALRARGRATERYERLLGKL